MTRAAPLHGLTVVEIGHSVAAPFAGLVLSDLGAEVLKVENPRGGDTARGWGPPDWGEDAALFHAYNRGKKSLAVDLADPAAAAGLRRLIIERADVVIQNLRAGALARCGLDAEALRAEKPALICCDVTAFGTGGPLAPRPGYDPLMQAFGGLMSITGEGGGRPPVRTGASMIDMGAGLWAVIGILVSLLAREREDGGAGEGAGPGASVHTSLYETALTWLMGPLAGHRASGALAEPRGSGVNEIVPYQCFPTRDGWLMIAAGSDGLYRRLCAALDRPGWAEDPRFARNRDRVAHRDALLLMIEAVTGACGRDDLMARLDAAGVPNAPLQDLAQVLAHPQTRATGIVQDGGAGSLPVVGLPLTIDGARPAHRWPTPRLGAHDAELPRAED